MLGAEPGHRETRDSAQGCDRDTVLRSKLGKWGHGARDGAGVMRGQSSEQSRAGGRQPSAACPGWGHTSQRQGVAPAALQMARGWQGAGWQTLLGRSGFSARKRWERAVSSPGRPPRPPAADTRGWPRGAVARWVPHPVGGSSERAAGRRISLPRRVAHTGPGARRRSGGGAVGRSRPCLAPQEPLGPGDQLSAAAAPAPAGSSR